MRRFFQIMAAIAVLSVTLTGSAYADDKAVYVVTYVETLPSAVDTAAVLLKHYRDVSRTQPGCSRFDMLQEIARLERFAIFAIWSDQAAFDAHVTSNSTSEFRRKLAEVQGAPGDQRVNIGLYPGPIANEPRLGSIYVLTHVDLIPESLGKGLTLLSTLRTASSQEPGNLAYAVLQQANRPNHFTVMEAWTGIKALQTHVAARYMLDFRQAILPMQGAPYDDRRYKKLP